MKFNWGTGIALFFSCFVVVLVSVVIKTTQYDHSLVLDKYYEADLKYQEQYDKIKNTQAFQQPVQVVHDATQEQLVINFPETMAGNKRYLKGNILLYKPDSPAQDRMLPFELVDQLTFMASSAALKRGRWKLKVDWTDGEKMYYQELSVVL